ncbi:MAG: CinA family protein [Planktomarina sp.]|uniref:CinA family protein n=1 Tax=Planktomarina sp. TaxID=2024851 RepID=UPI00326087BD|nr:CinA family protein [Planktomarina sp.]
MSAVAEEILRKAQAYGLKITCAESCTGGMISAALTDIAGSSAIFEQGFVTYSNAAKQKMLGVRPETLADYGAVSEPVTREMAEGALRQAQADIAISVSGIAGPGGSEFKPEGRVCFALASAQGTQSETQEFGARGRAEVRQAALNHALNLILLHLNLAH